MEPVVVSHYRLIDRLGEGGMGVVYRAQDLRLGREVAVKLLRKDANTPSDWLTRFEREARLASSLQHPHICTIHELGEHEGQPFIAMERLEGKTIRQLIESGPLPIPRVLHFARQIAEALDAAHRRSIIHRDIKPANIFVTYGDHLKVLDFGLAKTTTIGQETRTATAALASRTKPNGDPDLTAAGVAIGTASYMSPEQAHGQPLDARSDLFSLGSVLYEMLTGRRAFGGDDLALIAMRIVNGIVVPIRTIDPKIPPQVEALVQKLMATDPNVRYQSAADLLVEIKAAQQALDSPSGLMSAAPSAPVIARPSRSRWRWTAAAVIAVAFLAGVAKYTWSSIQQGALTDRDTILIGAFENTTDNPVFDETLATALEVQLRQSPFLDIVGDGRIRETLRSMGRPDNERLAPGIAREVCQRLGLKAMLDGSIRAFGSNYVLRLDATDCTSGEPLAREQAEASSPEAALRELGLMTSRMRTSLGESLKSIEDFDLPIEQATTRLLPALKQYATGLEERRRGREIESIAFFNQAIEMDREFASAYAMLSTIYGSLGEWKKSEEYAEEAFKRQKQLSERERLFITYQYYDRVKGNQEKAATELELWKAAYPRESRPVNALALLHHRMGRHERAIEEAKEALRRSPGQGFPLSNLAIAYRSLGRYQEAADTARQAIAGGVATVPTRRLLYQLGMLAGDRSAQEQLDWAKDQPREFDFVSAQAQIAAYEGRLDAAGDLYRRAVDMAMARRFLGTASGHAAHFAWAEALLHTDPGVADRVRRILAISGTDVDEGAGTIPRFRAAAALGVVGLPSDAMALVTRTEAEYPEATFVRTVLAPVTRAAIALQQHRPDEAIDALKAATTTELGTVAGLVPIYLRGEALLQKGRYAEAVAEYARVIQHRGVDPFAPVIPLAHLGMARAHALNGDAAASRKAYDELFTIWKGADGDLAPLVAARAEYARLTGTGSRP
jgi:tetratricopeptide (TPR) repeat protein